MYVYYRNSYVKRVFYCLRNQNDIVEIFIYNPHRQTSEFQ